MKIPSYRNRFTLPYQNFVRNPSRTNSLFYPTKLSGRLSRKLYDGNMKLIRTEMRLNGILV